MTKGSPDLSIFSLVKVVGGFIVLMYLSCTIRSACEGRQAEFASERQASKEGAAAQLVVEAEQAAAEASTRAAAHSVLRAGAERAAFEINAELSEVQSLLSAGRALEAETLLKKAEVRLDEYQEMEPLPPEIVTVQGLFKQRQQQVIHLVIPLNLSTSLEAWFNQGEALVAGASDQNIEMWLAATDVWEKAVIVAMTLETMDESQRPYVHAQLKAIRRKLEARLKKAAHVLKPYHAQQALLKICGPAPSGCGGGWDGECIGAKGAFKRVAHDPRSVDVENCTQPVLSSKHCWVSTCEVRAKNAFGAKVRSVHKFSFSNLGVEVL